MGPLIFSMFLPHDEFWPFLGPSLLQDVRVLPHPKFLVNFGPISTFSTVRGTFLAEEEAQNLEFLPHPEILGHFWAALSKMSCRLRRHTVSIVSCVFRNKQQRKTLADKQYSPCFLVKTSPAEGPRRFHKNTAYAR